jgi:hypothetical protein
LRGCTRNDARGRSYTKKKLGLEEEGGTERARKESTVMEMDLVYGMPRGSMHLGKYAFGEVCIRRSTSGNFELRL